MQDVVVTGMAIALGLCAIIVSIRCMSSIAYVVIILLLVHLYLTFVLVPEIQAVYQCPPCPSPTPISPPPVTPLPPIPKWQQMFSDALQWINSRIPPKGTQTEL